MEVNDDRDTDVCLCPQNHKYSSVGYSMVALSWHVSI